MSANEQPVFEVRLRSKRVQRELDGLQGVDYDRVLARLRALAREPRPAGCEKLHGDIHRVRVGDVRIIYRVSDTSRRVEVGGIRRRRERTYKGLHDLFR